MELATDPAVDFNWVGEDRGDTSLHRACRFGWLEIVKVLLVQEKIEVNTGNKTQASPLFIACQENYWEVAALMLADPRADPNQSKIDGATPLFMACQQGHMEVVSLLLADPRVDTDKPRENGATPFFQACQQGHQEVVSLLFVDPRVDPNRPINDGATPFFVACQNGHKEVISLLLADPRIDPNKSQRDQSTPLWQASQNGHLVLVQHLLAAGREIDTRRKSAFNNRTAAEQGRAMGARTVKLDTETVEVLKRRKANGPLCADLIDEHEREPVATRHRLRCQIGLREYFIGHLFALVVFHADSFVVIKEGVLQADITRFFRITYQLPLDLQMVLCNRIFGSPRDIILSRDSEPGFQLLTRTTTW